MTPKQREAILQHGLALLRIFPDSPYSGAPTSLCKRVRRLENEAHRLAERCCCEDVPEAEQERKEASILRRVREALADTEERVRLNGDPRGYALKIDLREGEQLHTDWGGYGIVAPEIGPEGR